MRFLSLLLITSLKDYKNERLCCKYYDTFNDICIRALSQHMKKLLVSLHRSFAFIQNS